jgi:O-antigen ligase
LILAAALGWTLFAAAVGPAPRSALLGFAGRDLSALTVVGASGCWLIGRSVSARGRSALADVFVAATAFAACVGILQVIFDVTSGPLALASGRPTGFVTNPVYFGAICSSGLVAAVVRWPRGGSLWLAASILVLGAGTSLSGSRVALLAVIVALAAVAVVHRSRVRVGAVGLGVLSLAIGVGLDRWLGAGRNAADRLSENTGGGRLTVWRYGLEGWLDRPVLGYGFGRFRPAVQGRFSVDFVRENAVDDVSQAWFDAHNVGIGVLVAVGIVGAVAFVAWAVLSARHLRGPLAWALAPIVLHWLLQPVSLFTLPLAMLLFGAAAVVASATGEVAPATEPVSVPGWAVVGSLGLGMVIATGLVIADLALERSADSGDGDQAASVAGWYFGDPVVDDVVAQVYAFDPVEADPVTAELDWRGRATEHEPDRPLWWSKLADVQIAVGELDSADASLVRAFELQPNNVRTEAAAAALALARRDEAGLDASLARLCALGQAVCDLTAAELLDDTDGS